MLFLTYAIPLAAWVAFVYVQHHFGDRPTTHNWWALMTALGVFELGKGMFGLIVPEHAVTMALFTAFVCGGLVQVAWVRSSWPTVEESDEYAEDLLATNTH